MAYSSVWEDSPWTSFTADHICFSRISKLRETHCSISTCVFCTTQLCSKLCMTGPLQHFNLCVLYYSALQQALYDRSRYRGRSLNEFLSCLWMPEKKSKHLLHAVVEHPVAICSDLPLFAKRFRQQVVMHSVEWLPHSASMSCPTGPQQCSTQYMHL